MNATLEHSERHHVSVRERDLDNFLLEELKSSNEFREWFLGRLAHCVDVPEHSALAVGKNPKREVTPGQTDLSLALLDSAKRPILHVLIENKVNRGFEPGQPERYADEVAAARERLGKRRAAAVLVAPSGNSAVLEHPCFDVSVRLEEIVAHLRDRREVLINEPSTFAMELVARIAVRIALLEALISKHNYNGSWTPNPLPERLDFMSQYRNMAKQLAPNFRTTDSSGGRKSTTILFAPPTVTGLPIANIRHDFPGRVSLVLKSVAKNEALLVKSGLLPAEMSTSGTKAGSLLVTISTPALDPHGDRFIDQLGEVEAAIRAAVKLYDWARDNARELARIVD